MVQHNFCRDMIVLIKPSLAIGCLVIHFTDIWQCKTGLRPPAHTWCASKLFPLLISSRSLVDFAIGIHVREQNDTDAKEPIPYTQDPSRNQDRTNRRFGERVLSNKFVKPVLQRPHTRTHTQDPSRTKLAVLVNNPAFLLLLFTQWKGANTYM